MDEYSDYSSNAAGTITMDSTYGYGAAVDTADNNAADNNADNTGGWEYGGSWEYPSGYENPDVYASYQTNTETSWDLWNASTNASIAGDSEGAYDLNQASIAAQSEAGENWNQYNGYGEYGATYTEAPVATESYAASYATPDYSAPSTTQVYDAGTDTMDTV